MSITLWKETAPRRVQAARALLSDTPSEGRAAKSRAPANHPPAKVLQVRSASVWTKRDHLSKPLRTEDFVGLYEKDPLEHVGLVKHGVSALLIDLVADGMGVSKDKLLATLGLPRATIQRKAKANQSLTAEESSRVLGISRLIGQTQAMVEASGNPEGFDAAAWVAQWLDQPLPALGGQRPAALMDTAEGQAIVSNMLSRAQSGAYA